MVVAVRDSQRQRVYDAESRVLRQLELAARGARTVTVAGSRIVLPLERRFGSLAGVQAYVDAVRRHPEIASRWPRQAAAPLRVRQRRGGAQAHYESPGVLALHAPGEGVQRSNSVAAEKGDWALRELVVLHELAHHVTWHDLPSGPAHGPAFAGALVHLAAVALGPEVGLALTAALAEHGVAVTPVAATPVR